MKNDFRVSYRKGLLRLFDRFLENIRDLDIALDGVNPVPILVQLEKLEILRETLAFFLPENFESKKIPDMDRHIHFLKYNFESKHFDTMKQDAHDLLTRDLPKVREDIDSFLVPMRISEEKVEPHDIVSDIDSYLRFTLAKTPKNETEVQDALEILLKLKGYKFDREKVTIPYSTKSYRPDFTSDHQNIAIDVKLCDSSDDEKRIIDEINADIPAYRKKYADLLFVVYDLQIIRDVIGFCQGIQENNPNVSVLVIKH